MVVIFHSSAEQFGQSFNIGTLGIDAVMVFFVLSGLVISFVADSKETSPLDYSAARLARLWSVLIPALILTYFADKLGAWLQPSLYQGWAWNSNGPVVTLLPSVFFANELWWSPVAPLSDGPVWSICFEFWYYAIFAILLFARGPTRTTLVALACIIAGPRILLLLPVWLLGVAVYYAGIRWRVSEATGGVLFVLPLAALAFAYALRLNHRLDSLGLHLLGGDAQRWMYVHNFLWWYAAGPAVAVHFFGAWNISDRLEFFLRRVRRWIACAASYTLSVYLFHFPILLVTAAAIHRMHEGIFRRTLLVAVTLALCLILGFIFEPQRYRLRAVLRSIFANPVFDPKRDPGTIA